MDKIIEDLRRDVSVAEYRPVHAVPSAAKALRLLEECRALLERLAAGEPAPEGHTFQSWAEDLLQ